MWCSWYQNTFGFHKLHWIGNMFKGKCTIRSICSLESIQSWDGDSLWYERALLVWNLAVDLWCFWVQDWILNEWIRCALRYLESKILLILISLFRLISFQNELNNNYWWSYYRNDKICVAKSCIRSRINRTWDIYIYRLNPLPLICEPLVVKKKLL